VALTADQRPDIVVLDLGMPDLDGLQAAQQILLQFPQTLVIILTGHDPLQFGDVFAEFGVRTCLSKTELPQLVDTIDRVWQEIQNRSRWEVRPHASS
jgi:DNA-binding NarL/FixJ family response regulator